MVALCVKILKLHFFDAYQTLSLSASQATGVAASE
jgi:hypothetical protein